MKKVMKLMMASILAAALAAAVVVFVIVLGTLMGAVGGWIVGWFFGDTILAFFSYIFGAAHGFSMWDIGAALGFIGGYFKSAVSLKTG